jgi:hypothetical protein
VAFPIVGKTGELIGIQGSKIADGEFGSKMLTNGRGGVFVAGTTWPIHGERVAIVEAPIDPLSLAAVLVPDLAIRHELAQQAAPALAFKEVALAHDNDEFTAKGQRRRRWRRGVRSGSTGGTNDDSTARSARSHRPSSRRSTLTSVRPLTRHDSKPPSLHKNQGDSHRRQRRRINDQIPQRQSVAAERSAAGRGL